VATYKQPCIHCGEWLERDARFCPKCGSYFPFGYACPHCLRDVRKDYQICPGCGRALYIACPHCGGRTFVQEYCECCRKTLMVQCSSKRCGAMQFFENERCTACGKKLKAQLEK